MRTVMGCCVVCMAIASTAIRRGEADTMNPTVSAMRCSQSNATGDRGDDAPGPMRSIQGFGSVLGRAESDADLLHSVKLLADTGASLLAITVAFVAFRQLHEIKNQRLADMSWRLFEVYSSPAMAHTRDILHLIEGEFATAEDYRERYHDQPDGTQAKMQDKEVRGRVRYFHQAGSLLNRKLVDRDLLFSLIGTGLKQDHRKLKIVVDGVRLAHNDQQMYRYFDDLWGEYERWERSSGGTH